MAMDFTQAAGKVRSLIAAKKPQNLQRSALTDDALRDNVIAEEAARTERFKAHTRKVPRIEFESEDEDGNKEQHTYDWTSFPEMLRDVARASFSYDEPEIAPADKVRPSHQLNREIMAETMISEGFQESRPYTRGNPMESLFNSMAQAKDLQESAKTRLAEHIARSEQMAEQEEDMRSAEEMMDELRKQARAQIDAAGQVKDQTKRKIKGQVKKRQAARETLSQLAQQQAQSNMVQAAAAAAQSAAEAGADAVEAMNSIPGVGGGEAHNLSPDQQIALAEKWADNKELMEIAKMLGRMYRDMRFKRETRVKNVPIEPVGVTVGRDLERLLPTELARGFSDNKLIKTTFLRDWAEGTLLSYEMSGKLPAGKGPIIECHDGSGSMSGEPFIWAASLGLALLTMAQREQRHFAGIEFGSAGQLKSWQFPAKQAPDPNAVLDYASHFYGGGTSTVMGMTEALRIVEEQPEFKTADVILIGDGQDYFREPDKLVRDRLRELGVRIHAISIMCPNNAYMEQMAEYVVDVTELAGSNDASDKIAENLT